MFIFLSAITISLMTATLIYTSGKTNNTKDHAKQFHRFLFQLSIDSHMKIETTYGN